MYVEAHVSAQRARKRGADVFFCKWGEGMRMRIMSKSFFLQKKEEKNRFPIKSGCVCFFFSRGTAQNFKGD